MRAKAEGRKYPRTPHHPWSPGVWSNDKVTLDIHWSKGPVIPNRLRQETMQ